MRLAVIHPSHPPSSQGSKLLPSMITGMHLIILSFLYVHSILERSLWNDLFQQSAQPANGLC